VIAFALRLTLRGGREALARLIVIAAAVMIGVALLLTALAGIAAVHAQNNRFAWLETGAAGAAARHAVADVDPEWWLLTADEYDGEQIGRVDIAATGPSSPVPPGLPELPRPGEYYASPALAALIRSAPHGQLADRYPGRMIGTIGAAGLPSPSTLVVVVGRAASTLAATHRAVPISRISTTPPDQCNGACYSIGFDSNSIDLILSVVTAAILFPILIFIGTATRLSAARRNQRFAAMRLVGATPRQVATISTVESTLATALGVAGGFALFLLTRPLLADVPFTGSKFFSADLSLSITDIVAVAAGVPIAAAIAARLALRRVVVSPLGVSRRVTPTPPKPWRLIPLVLGLGELVLFAVIGRPPTIDGQIAAYLTGVLLTMIGLVIAGPWLTMIGSRALVRRARKPASLIAARRLADNPGAAFRAVSGLVLSLFVASIAFGIITTFDGYRASEGSSSVAATSTLVADLTFYGPRSRSAPIGTLPAPARQALRRTTGVEGIVELHAGPGFARPGPQDPLGFVSCAELATVPRVGRCPSGAQSAVVKAGYGDGWEANPDTVWPASARSAAAVDAMPVETVVVATDGSTTAIERARTVLENSVSAVDGFAPTTIAEQQSLAADTQRSKGYQRLADVVILTSLPIAGCTLAVSIVAGLNDRRRPFGLLRLTGAPLAVLRRVVTLETAVPLLLSALAATAAGFASAYLFLRSQLDETLQPPTIGYYLAVAAGIIASLALVASTLPVLDRITGPESARND
jgi:hypothetical protein